MKYEGDIIVLQPFKGCNVSEVWTFGQYLLIGINEKGVGYNEPQNYKMIGVFLSISLWIHLRLAIDINRFSF